MFPEPGTPPRWPKPHLVAKTTSLAPGHAEPGPFPQHFGRKDQFPRDVVSWEAAKRLLLTVIVLDIHNETKFRSLQ